uniref:Uncharacterized protein n=1 Tax=uncultured delta proteobacterium HF0200_39N20 TaxID=710833 RepID=E0XUW5_9DELT|nr:hypothetical protein [uncultured delta proteobacterium HF0200_39N20]
MHRQPKQSWPLSHLKAHLQSAFNNPLSAVLHSSCINIAHNTDNFREPGFACLPAFRIGTSF